MSGTVLLYGEVMETTYTHARANFASICEHVTSSREPVIIHRRGAEDVALVSAEDLRSLIATAHELSSPVNAARLLAALGRARSRETSPRTVESLREEFGLTKSK